MSEAIPLEMQPKDFERLVRLLAHYLPNITVWAYGSRVTGTATSRSDLDLVAFTNSSQATALSELREALEESNLSFRVDLFVWDQIPESFQHNIEKCFVVVQAGTECENG